MCQCAVDGPGRMAPPPLGDRVQMNGAYRHPALDARGVDCIAEAARITRDRPVRPFNAPSLLLFRRWRSELGGPHYNGARNSLVHFTSLYPDPLLRSRPACARTARSARPDPRITQLGLRVSPNFAVVRALCASVCPSQFAVRLVLTRRGRAPRQGPRAAARRPGVPVASSRAACLQRPSAGRPQNDPRISWRSAVSLASSTSNHVVLA